MLQTHALGICKTGFLLQQWLRKHASVFIIHTHITCFAVNYELDNWYSICGSERSNTSFQTIFIQYYSGIHPTTHPIGSGYSIHSGNAARV
jgi:hypothetical protein